MAVSKRNRAAGLLALIVVLLLALTALQYGLIVELSDFQRQQMERTLRVSTDRFVRHLDDEFERLWYVFHVRRGRAAGEEIAQDYAEWVESVDVPGIVGQAFWVREVSDSAGGVGESAETLEISEIDLASGRLEQTPWPPWLADLREPMRESANSHRGRDFHESDSFTASAGTHGMAFVVAQTRLATKSWAVVLLQRDAMIEQFLPSLVREHFGPDNEREYEVRIFDDAQEGRTIFASAPGALPATSTTPDAVRYLRDFGGSLQSRDGGRSRSLAVAVTHGAGSLDTAVARLRGRNLALSFGVVVVLGASIGVLAVAAQLRVDDSGPGIEASELSRIFEPFFRGRSARAGQVEGSGLGLSLVKEVVDAHGGRVVVTSEPAKGSTFVVYLPVAKAAATYEPIRRPAEDTNDATESRRAPADRLQAAGSGGDLS